MLLWLAFILLVLIIVAASSGTTKSYQSRPVIKSNPNVISPAEEILYKVREIKSFEMKGMYYRNLTMVEYLEFQGYAETEENPHDKYAVAVYNIKGLHLGYVSRGHKRLSDSINAWHDSKVFAWGNIQYNKYKDRWYGGVYIPIGLTDIEIQTIKTIFTLKERRNELLDLQEPSTEESFQILSIQHEILSLFNSLEKPTGIFIELPSRFVTRLSIELEKNKDYASLVRLGEYDELIQTVNKQYLNAILKRIETAKQKLVIT